MPVIPFHDENPVQRRPYVTTAIIVINVLALLYVQGLGEHGGREFRARHGFVPLRVKQLTIPKPVRVALYSPEEMAAGVLIPNGKFPVVDLAPVPSQILACALTSLFLHGGWMHLIGNMWFFWIFGDNIEDRLGHFVFLLFYLLGGVIASICHYSMIGPGGETIPVIGASGAVAVTLGAYAVTYPFTRVRTLIFLVVFFTVVELPALVVLGFWFFMQIANATQAWNLNIGGGVAWWAHVGGFAAGAIIMPFLAAGSPDAGHNWKIEAEEQFDYEVPNRDYT